MERIRACVAEHEERFLAELMDFLRIPSVSAVPAHARDVRHAALWLVDRFRETGAQDCRLIDTAGHPLVFAEYRVSPDLPTILCYGHYDVQPPDPLGLWHCGPFEPVRREGRIVARGASDDKGQAYLQMKAVDVLRRTHGLPCNVKFIVEGEEEVGSTALSTFLPANRELLKADVVLVSDTAMLPGNVPAITVGLRGIVALEVEVEGPSRDLHSGIYGGAVANPATMLCRMLSSLHTNDGAIAVPGYYDEVVPLSQEERAMLAQAPFDAERFMREIGVAACIGESAFTPLERTTIRPSLDINGMISGYTGPGSKTVLPSKASAKLTARLVPNQDASVAAERIARFLREHVPSGGRATVSVGHGAEPVVVSMDHPGYRAASQAMAEVWGRSPVPIRGGGSIPVVALFHSVLRVPPLLMGFGQDADAIHSPNESFGVENYLKGIETVASFMRHYVQLISQG